MCLTKLDVGLKSNRPKLMKIMEKTVFKKDHTGTQSLHYIFGLIVFKKCQPIVMNGHAIVP